MVIYSCLRCGYETTYKTNFKNHLKRKYICEAKLEDVCLEYIYDYYNLYSSNKKLVNNTQITHNNTQIPHKNTQKHINNKSLICQHCGKIFSRIDSLSRHKKKYCKKNKKKNKETDELKKEISMLKKENILLKKLREEDKKNIMKEVEKLIIKNMKSKVTNIHNNLTNSNNKTINNNNIIINNYGEENVDYITDKILTKLLRNPDSSLVKLIRIKHFDPNHPENRNIRITNKKLPFAEVVEDKKWKLRKKEHVLEELVDKNSMILDIHYEEKEGKMRKKTKNKYEEYQNKLDHDNKFRDSKKTDIELEILNANREIEI